MFSKQNARPRTLSKVELKIPSTLKEFDESDLKAKKVLSSSPVDKIKAGQRGQIIQRLNRARRTVPDHLLVVSLIEQLCKVLESNPERSTQLFQITCQKLADMKQLPPLFHQDEFSSMRAQYQSALSNLLKSAVATLPKEPRHLALPFTLSEKVAHLMQNGEIVPHHMQIKKEEFFNAFTSRYREEFIELGTLGKGGFGRVYKVKNKLDGRNYAVKKILLKENDPDVCLKILREAKLLAGMHHPNIVGYNNAWLERVSLAKTPFKTLPPIDVDSSLSSQSSDEHVIESNSFSSDSIIFASSSHLSTQRLGIEYGKYRSKKEECSHPECKSVGVDSGEFETPMNSPREGYLSSRLQENREEEDSFETPMNSPKHSHLAQMSLSSVTEKAHFQTGQMMITFEEHHRTISSEMRQSNGKVTTADKGTMWRFQHQEEQISIEQEEHAEYDDSTEDEEIDVIDTSLSRSVNGFTFSAGLLAEGSYSSRNKMMNRSYSWEPESGEHYARRHGEQKYSSDDGIEYGPSGGLFGLQYGIMLFIQMQICSHTLRDWLVERNTSQFQSPTDPFSVVDVDMNMKIFKELLEGVGYIHNQGLMHRDLKPRNIFLDITGIGDSRVLIGDFGLAREDAVDRETPLTPMCTDVTAASCHQCSDHTSGVGTYTYASPEQLKGSFYDSKSDMYSVGIILFELFHPFGTEMERVRCLSDIREGKIPDIIKDRWPIQHSVIQRLLAKESALRPSARDVLNGEMYKSKDEVIARLESTVSKQDQELMALRKQLKDQAELISKLQRQSLK